MIPLIYSLLSHMRTTSTDPIRVVGISNQVREQTSRGMRFVAVQIESTGGRG